MTNPTPMQGRELAQEGKSPQTKRSFVEVATRQKETTPDIKTGNHEGFTIVNHTKRSRMIGTGQKERPSLPKEQFERMIHGLSRKNKEVKILFVRGWKATESYSVMRNFFGDLKIASTWVKEMMWTNKDTLQMVVGEDKMDEIKSKINECPGIFVDEGYDWKRAISEKSKKGLGETLKGINKQIERLKGSSRPVRELITAQRDQVEMCIRESHQKETLAQPTQAPLMGNH
jgi:hypothetical protein